MFSKLSLLSTLALILAIACASHGSQFLGKWVNTKNANETMEIVRNGDGYLIQNETDKIGAVYKDEMLQVPGAFGGSSLTFVKASDSIVLITPMGKAEFKRLK